MQRVYPFGYHVMQGEITINAEEQSVVLRIFQSYAKGESYSSIAQALTEGDVRYHEGKAQWNKNMVARIIANEKYLGTAVYPRLIEDGCFNRATHRKPEPKCNSKTGELKGIKPLLYCSTCGAKIKKRSTRYDTERYYCENDHKHICIRVSTHSILAEVRVALTELSPLAGEAQEPVDTEEITRSAIAVERLLLGDDCDSELIKSMILFLAKDRYHNSNGRGGERAYREHLRLELLRQDEIDPYKLKQLASKLYMDFDGKLTIEERRT